MLAVDDDECNDVSDDWSIDVDDDDADDQVVVFIGVVDKDDDADKEEERAERELKDVLIVIASDNVGSNVDWGVVNGVGCGVGAETNQKIKFFTSKYTLNNTNISYMALVLVSAQASDIDRRLSRRSTRTVHHCFDTFCHRCNIDSLGSGVGIWWCIEYTLWMMSTARCCLVSDWVSVARKKWKKESFWIKYKVYYPCLIENNEYTYWYWCWFRSWFRSWFWLHNDFKQNTERNVWFFTIVKKMIKNMI